MLLVLPAALFLGAIGWCLMWVGSEKSSKRNVRSDVGRRVGSGLVSVRLVQGPVSSDCVGVPLAEELSQVETG